MNKLWAKLHLNGILTYKFFADDNIPEIPVLNELPTLDQISLALVLAFTQVMGLLKGAILSMVVYTHSTYNYDYVTLGKAYLLNDARVLWFTKKLN